jgi:hypothetical protein
MSRGYTGWDVLDPTSPVLQPRAKRHKYGAKKTEVDNITFDSKREAARYGELKLLEQAGEIGGLCCQPRYELCVTTEAGEIVTLGYYVGDFRYVDGVGDLVVEDVKSPPTKTPIWRWKVKHLRAQYGIVITEVL